MRVSLNAQSWDRALAQLGQKSAIKAGVRAVNRTLSSARTAMVRVIAPNMGLAAKVVRDRIDIKAAKDTGVAPSGYLFANTKPIPLIDFKAKFSKRRGVTARIGAPGKGHYPNAFIARVKGKNKDGTSGNHLGVFERNTVIRSRKGKGLRRGSPALGIHQLYGPSIAHVFTNHAAVAEARAAEMLDKNWAHEVAFLLQRATQAV